MITDSLACAIFLFGLFLKNADDITTIIVNNTPHASRQLCAPWGVSFFRSPLYGGLDA